MPRVKAMAHGGGISRPERMGVEESGGAIVVPSPQST
jgi:hypothetical protein